MTISIRDDILDAFKTALGNIKTTSGYNLTPALIDTRMKMPEELTADQFPALFLVDTDETKSDGDVDELRCRLQIIVSGYVKQSIDTEDVQETVRKLLADVENAVCADRFLGGIAVNTKPIDIKTDHGVMQPYGIFDLTFEVEYFQKYGDVENV